MALVHAYTTKPSVRNLHTQKEEGRETTTRSYRCWNVLNSCLLLDRNPQCNGIVCMTKILVGLVQQQQQRRKDLASQYYIQVLQCTCAFLRACGAKHLRKSCGRIKKHMNSVNNQLLASQRQQEQKNISSEVDPVKGGACSQGSGSLPPLAVLLHVAILGGRGGPSRGGDLGLRRSARSALARGGRRSPLVALHAVRRQVTVGTARGPA